MNTVQMKMCERLVQYSASGTDVALYKDIPIADLKEVQRALRGMGFRYRFRGPRYDSMRAYTLKRHANRFAIYVA